MRHVYKSHWDSEKNTVLPSAVYDVAMEEKGNSEKMIIHFVQPHNPFLDFKGNLEFPGMSKYGDNKGQLDNVWKMAEKEEIEREEIVSGYKRNLEYVLEYVEELVEELEGKTVVTSDHGELLGESGLYGHNYGSKAQKLREVPWDVRE